MITLEIFDPPMCCATGVCSPDPDPSRGPRRHPTRRELAGFVGLTLEADPA